MARQMKHAARFLLVAAALIASILLLAAPSDLLPLRVAADMVCIDDTPLQNGDVVNVAVMVWLIGEPNGLYRGRIADTPASPVAGYGRNLAQPVMLGFDLYRDLLAERGNLIPLANGHNVTVNIVYINLPTSSAYGNVSAYGSVDYTKTDPSSGFPLFMAYAAKSDLAGTPASPGGMFSLVTSTDPAVLKREFNLTKPFTFLIPPPLLSDVGVGALVNMVEEARSHIVISSFLTSKEAFICDGLPFETSATPDCVSPKYNRSRLEGARRYQSLFNVLLDSTMNQQAALDSYHVLGAKSVLIVREPLAPGTTTFAKWAAAEATQSAEQLGLEVLGEIVLQTGLCGTDQALPNCPPYNDATKYQRYVWPNNQTGMDVARHIAELNPDAVILLLSTSTGAWSLAQMVLGWQVLGWTPKSLSFGGGQDVSLAAFLPTPDDLLYSFTTQPWDARLKGPLYKNKPSGTTFEMLPANATHDGPAVFQDEYDRRYGPGSQQQPGGAAHPMWQAANETVVQSVGWTNLMMVQALLESAMSSDVAAILQAAPRVSRPGVYHALQFDLYGRTARVNEILLQRVPTTVSATGRVLLAPYNIAVPAIYPLPTWDERVFSPKYFSTSNEQIMVAANAVCIFLCMVAAGFVLANSKTAVIRAATPSFCIVIIVGGILMLLSNFSSSLHVNDAHCAAQIWLLTLGFTCMFASMFIKTFRIWRIFGARHLHVLKMRDRDLLVYLGAFLAVDVLVNALWQATAGMSSRLEVPDPIRPKFNYVTCDYTPGAIVAIYIHIAIKGGLLLVGVALTWAVRNIPSLFNESTLIALCIYNIVFVLCFVVPIIAVGLGGRSTTFMVRNFAVMFVSLSTISLLFLPKLRSLNGVTAIVGAGKHGANNTMMEDEGVAPSKSGGGNITGANKSGGGGGGGTPGGVRAGGGGGGGVSGGANKSGSSGASGLIIATGTGAGSSAAAGTSIGLTAAPGSGRGGGHGQAHHNSHGAATLTPVSSGGGGVTRLKLPNDPSTPTPVGGSRLSRASAVTTAGAGELARRPSQLDSPSAAGTITSQPVRRPLLLPTAATATTSSSSAAAVVVASAVGSVAPVASSGLLPGMTDAGASGSSELPQVDELENTQQQQLTEEKDSNLSEAAMHYRVHPTAVDPITIPQ